MEVAQNDHTNQSHKSIAQMIAQDKMMSCPRMEMIQSNSGAYGGPETG